MLNFSITSEALAFVERYRKTHLGKTRSEVVQEAIALLHERELETAYREARAEVDLDWEPAKSASDPLAPLRGTLKRYKQPFDPIWLPKKF